VNAPVRTLLRQKVAYRLWGLPRRPVEVDGVSLLLGTLRRVGWMRSLQAGVPVDLEGGPIPWWTYPAIYWLDRVLDGSERVLEYGAGHSTLWLAGRAATVTSIEHDERWAERIEPRAPANVRIERRRCSGDLLDSVDDDPYLAPLAAYPEPNDVIVVDGLARRSCLRLAPAALAGDGLIVLDNADRPEFAAILAELQAAGFGRIDFVGPVPGGTNFSCTSVLSRDLIVRARAAKTPVSWGSEIPDFGVVR
jgi:hypothetical protein